MHLSATVGRVPRSTLLHLYRQEGGRGLVWLALALPPLLGLVGLTIDTGRLYLARQRVVNVCDASALGGTQQLLGNATDTVALRTDVLAAVQANVQSAHPEWAVAVSDSPLNANPDIIVAGFNDTPETNSTLSEPMEWRDDSGNPLNADNPPTYAPAPGTALMVRGRAAIGSTFMSVLGFGSTTIPGSATVMRACPAHVTGTEHLAPIWISGVFTPGQQVTLTLDNGSGGVPSGSYGFIDPRTFEPYTFKSSEFHDWLQFGPSTDAGLTVYTQGPLAVGTPGVITAYTGWNWGQVKHAIDAATGSLAASDPATYGARIERQVLLFPEDTPTGPDSPYGLPPGDPTNPSLNPDDPRIIVVPLVDYHFGTGSNALFTIRGFAAFWVNRLGPSSEKSLIANFINYTVPGSKGGPCAGVWVYSLVR